MPRSMNVEFTRDANWLSADPTQTDTYRYIQLNYCRGHRRNKNTEHLFSVNRSSRLQRRRSSGRPIVCHWDRWET